MCAEKLCQITYVQCTRAITQNITEAATGLQPTAARPLASSLKIAQ